MISKVNPNNLPVMWLTLSGPVPLHKISVISYGEEKPVSPNNTRDGRAQNRRVVIRVLS